MWQRLLFSSHAIKKKVFSVIKVIANWLYFLFRFFKLFRKHRKKIKDSRFSYAYKIYEYFNFIIFLNIGTKIILLLLSFFFASARYCIIQYKTNGLYIHPMFERSSIWNDGIISFRIYGNVESDHFIYFLCIVFPVTQLWLFLGGNSSSFYFYYFLKAVCGCISESVLQAGAFRRI